MSCYIVADVPTTGFSITEQKQIVDAMTAWLSASSGANVTRLLGGES
jgi:ABC-type dipeptide/oligopeptide/nickel transport system ATPase component